MAWSGIEAIPLLSGESRAAAVRRAYAGGTSISFVDHELVVETIGGQESDHTYVSRAGRAWMTAAITAMEELRPGWVTSEQLREEGRRWPWMVQLDHRCGSMWVELFTDSITFRWVKGAQVDDEEWRFWWRTIRRFAAWPAVIVHPDETEVIATAMSAKAARLRYNWM